MNANQSRSIGEPLPPLTIEATPTFVVASAIATRDFQDVHHDRDLAQAKGSSDIFVNILTDTGLVERFVTDWAGPAARITSITLKLGVPWYAGDTLTLTGDVVSLRQASRSTRSSIERSSSVVEPVRSEATSRVETTPPGTETTVAVTGTNSLGKHVIATVTFTEGPADE